MITNTAATKLPATMPTPTSLVGSVESGKSTIGGREGEECEEVWMCVCVCACVHVCVHVCKFLFSTVMYVMR